MCLSSFFLNKETLYTYHTLLACLPVGRDWGHQHFLAFMSDASINIRVQGVAWTCVVSSPGWTRTRRTVGSYGGYTSDFLINRKTMSQSSGSAALPPVGGGPPLPSHPHQRCTICCAGVTAACVFTHCRVWGDFIKSPMFISSFRGCVYGILSKKSLLNPRSWTHLP